MLLFSYSLSWCQTINTSKGELPQADSCALIPISIIRQANVKLIERESLLQIVEVQDSIITDYKRYVVINNSILTDYNNLCKEQETLNKSLNNQINKTKNWNKTLIGVSCAAIISSLFFGLSK